MESKGLTMLWDNELQYVNQQSLKYPMNPQTRTCEPKSSWRVHKDPQTKPHKSSRIANEQKPMNPRAHEGPTSTKPYKPMCTNNQNTCTLILTHPYIRCHVANAQWEITSKASNLSILKWYFHIRAKSGFQIEHPSFSKECKYH